MRRAHYESLARVNHRLDAPHAPFALSWNACADQTKLIEHFEGQPCWIGLDLVSKEGIAELVAVFKHPEIADAYVAFGKYYLPEDMINGVSDSPYSGWMLSGRLIVTLGKVINSTG